MKQTIGFRSILSKAMIFALLWLIAVQPDPVIAKIYKYKDENGKTHFTDDPSNIPMRYRKKESMDSFRGVSDPATDTSSKSSGKKDKNKTKKDEGLSSRDAALIRRTIPVLKAGIARSERYKNIIPTFRNGRAAAIEIQSGLPAKESLAKELEGAKAPQLQGVLGFLKQSIAQDQQDKATGNALKKRIAGIFARIVAEGEQQSTLVKGLEKALKDDEKKKAEAKKKREEAKKKAAEEAEKKAAEEAEKKAGELEKSVPEAVYNK